MRLISIPEKYLGWLLKTRLLKQVQTVDLLPKYFSRILIYSSHFKNRNRTTLDVILYVNKQFGIFYSRSGMDVLLLNHGMRGHINISGAVDLERADVIVNYPKKVNAESTVKTLMKIEAYYPEAETITVILDNAGSHHSAFVKNYAQRSKNLVFLRAYSVNLNLMERVWGLLKRQSLSNSFYETFFDFKNNIKIFFRKTLKTKKEEWLIPLISDEFQYFDGRLIS